MRHGEAAGARRRVWPPAALVLLACLGLAPGRAVADADDDLDALPSATTVEKVTWTTSPGATRLDFHGVGVPAPRVHRPSDGMVAIDFAAVDVERVPRRLDVDTREVRSIVLIPASMGVLPEGVSARWLASLARTDVDVRVDASSGGMSVLIGDASKVGTEEAESDEDTSWVLHPPPTRMPEVPPEKAELFSRATGVALPADGELRAGPSALAARVGTLPAGEKRLADARRGEWLHLTTGGWLRLPEETTGAAARTPMAWAVVTLGTGLDLRVEEVMPGDEQAAAVMKLYRDPVKLARFRVAVDPGTSYSFRLPSKKGRVVLALAGQRVESLEPTSLPLRDASSRARLDLAMAARDLSASAAWTTWLVFPADLDFTKVTAAQVDVDGRLHEMFRVPGSGEAR